MAKIKFKGIDAYAQKLEMLGKRDAAKAIRYAIYPAADIVADEIKESIPVSDDQRSAGDLRDGLTLTHMIDSDGFISTTATFAGYDHKGTPLPLVARALESGRSTPEGKVGKHPFMRQAVNRTRKKAEELMQVYLDRYLYEYMRK